MDAIIGGLLTKRLASLGVSFAEFVRGVSVVSERSFALCKQGQIVGLGFGVEWSGAAACEAERRVVRKLLKVGNNEERSVIQLLREFITSKTL
jgi:hypothetical protein